MLLRPLNVVELLAIARDLAVQTAFDNQRVVELCTTLLKEDLDAQLVGAIKHAQLVATAGSLDGNSAREAVARFALARVVVLLEQHIAPRLVRP